MSATNDAGWNRVLGFLAWLVTVVLAAGLATLASVDAERFYGQLAKPDWAPGSGIFAPVWTVLYLLMAVAAWLVLDLWSAAAPGPITDDFLRLLEASFARDWRRPRTWPWTRVAWAYGFAFVGVTSALGMSLLVSALSGSPPARAPAGLIETSQQFRVIQ